MRQLKNIITMLALLAAGFIGGTLLGFGIGYIVAGDGRNNVHGDFILVLLLTVGGAVAGSIVGAVTAYRASQRGP